MAEIFKIERDKLPYGYNFETARRIARSKIGQDSGMCFIQG